MRICTVFALSAALFMSTAQAAFALSPLALPSVGPVIADNVVRVHLSTYGEPTQASMEAIGVYAIEDNGKALSGAFTVYATANGIRIQTASGNTDLDGDIYIKAANLTPNNRIKINGAYQYAGDMRILNKGGKLKFINHVDIETYVCGVIPYEMSDAWPIETLKAQAVAARTYAYYIMNSRTRSGVEQDLVNTTANQVYFGYNSTFGNCLRAVSETKNMILKTTAGENVYACFSASNGGATESGPASGAAARDYAYLPVKDDPYDLAYALATTTYSGKLSIPKTLAIGDLRGNAAQPYKMLREKLAAAGIDVNQIAGDVTVNSIALTNPKSTGPDRRFTGAAFTLGIPNAADAVVSFGPYRPAGSTSDWPFLNEVLGNGTRFSILYLRDDGASWLLAGVRYGHGAGLSQVGAYQMAAGGQNFRDILTFYFNLGTAVNLIEMPWTDGSGGSGLGYVVTEVSKTGTVNVGSSVLNVRSGPATGYSVVTSLNNGAKVTITGQSADWWRVDLGSGKTGFVSGAFITLDAGSTTPAAPTTPVTPPPTTPATPATPTTPTTPATPTAKTGTVNTPGTYLNVRSGAGTNHSILGSLKHGASVTITGESGTWYTLSYNGKTAYVSKSFVTVSTSTTTPPPATPATPTTPAAPTTTAGTVNTPGTYLNIRSGAGTTYTVVGSLKHGQAFTITGESGSWYTLSYNGKTAYVSKSYVTKGAASATPPAVTTGQTGTVYNAPQGLYVRTGPGTNYKILGGLANGNTIKIAGQSGDWYKVSYAGKDAYVSKSYVK
jgi:SpoIID/LytB domain protein